jgi:NAD(P)-dependent dehydrogenase (short-subunit alcohol dehydrogenase family)
VILYKILQRNGAKMTKTVFITGASSGIGCATALYFYELGWNVIATMRNPEKRRTLLHEKGLPDLVHLDVTDSASVQSALDYAVGKYQKIDVLVNNAGYAVYGPFESASPEQVTKQFATNVFGLMEMTRALLPYFRAQHEGLVINVTSMGGRIGFPLYSVYNSSKWAVEGFSEALQYELKSLNIRVKTIEPGVIKTDFYDRSLDRSAGTLAEDPYAAIQQRAQKSLGEGGMTSGSEPALVAKTIYRAATDGSRRLRYPVGTDAKMVNFLRAVLPAPWFFSVLEKFTLG